MIQAKIARKYRLDPTALSKALNGRYKTISPKTASKLAKMLDMTVEDVVAAPPPQLQRRFYELYRWNNG